MNARAKAPHTSWSMSNETIRPKDDVMRQRNRLERPGAILLSLATLLSVGHAEILFVNVRTGNDGNRATQAEPVKTLERAATLLAEGAAGEPATIIVAPGLYSLDRCVTIRGRDFTELNRLTIEASVLPDDPQWQPGSMPVIVSTENPDRPGTPAQPSETYSLKVQVNHVTIQGLKFLGNPLPDNWHCCIERIGTDLHDLIVTQCMFLGDRNTSDIYCATLATGNRFVVDHCVFSNCHACAVFWDGVDGIGGKGCAMLHCVVDGALISGVWTCQTNKDFEFHHNIVAHSEYVWMRKPNDGQKYRVGDCALIGNRYFSGYGLASGPLGETGPEVKFDKDHIVTEGRLEFASHEMTHLAERSAGHHLNAGLFRERQHK